MENNNKIKNLNELIQLNLSPEELINMSISQGVNSNKKHVEMCQYAIDKINELSNPKDRMESAVLLEYIVNFLNASIKGWKQWCTLNGMNIITEEEFKELLPKMKNIAIEWLKIDKRITNAKTKEMEKKLEDFTSKSKTKKSEKKKYIQ